MSATKLNVYRISSILSADAPSVPNCHYLTKVRNPDGTHLVLGLDENNKPVFSTNIDASKDVDKTIEDLLFLVK